MSFEYYRVDVLRMLPSGGATITEIAACGRDSECAIVTGFAHHGDQLAILIRSSGKDSLTLTLVDAGGSSARTILRMPEHVTHSAERIAVANIAWNGTEYVVVWSGEGGPVRAMRFDRGGQPLDDRPIELAASGAVGSSKPFIAVTEEGVIIVYTRTAAENGDAPRAFTRTLARLPEPGRRRSAGY